MSLIESLRSARESYAVKFRDFVRIFTGSPSAVVCFFEGEDVKYYGARIEMLKPQLRWEAINCEGKGSALKLWELISSHELYSQAKTAFFLDPDFDKRETLPQTSNVYVTPCYSVENLYVTEAAAKRILRAEFGVTEVPDEDGSFAKCITLFRRLLSEFLDAIEPANCWILFHRMAESEDKNLRRLNLGSLNANNLVTVTIGAVRRNYTIFDLQTTTGNTKTVSEDSLSELARSFDRNERHLRFRGKFQAYFMRMFLSCLKRDANDENSQNFARRRNVPLNVSDRNFLSDLAQYADTPDCLRDFILGLN